MQPAQRGVRSTSLASNRSADVRRAETSDEHAFRIRSNMGFMQQAVAWQNDKKIIVNCDGGCWYQIRTGIWTADTIIKTGYSSICAHLLLASLALFCCRAWCPTHSLEAVNPGQAVNLVHFDDFESDDDHCGSIEDNHHWYCATHETPDRGLVTSMRYQIHINTFLLPGNRLRRMAELLIIMLPARTTVGNAELN